MTRRKEYSESSIIRIVGQFKGKNETTIHEIQSAYVRKDATRIKELLKKPKITNASALAQARLANQYINYIINKPSFETKRLVAKRYKIYLKDEFKANLVLLNNVKGGVKPPPPPLKFPEILGLGAYKYKHKRFYWETFGIKVESDSEMEVSEFLKRIDLSNREISFIKANGIGEYRVYVKYLTETEELGWVSTKRLLIPSMDEINFLFEDMNDYIESKIQYEIDDYFAIIKTLVEIRVRWY